LQSGSFFSPRSWFEVFKETSDVELTETNRHARLTCSIELLNDVTFIWFTDKKLLTLATSKNIHRIQLSGISTTAALRCASALRLAALRCDSQR